jgi:uncharacterized protein
MKSMTVLILAMLVGQEKLLDEHAALKQQGKSFFERLQKGEFAQATKDYDETMAKVFPEDKLKGVWTSLIGQMGPVQSMGEPRAEKVDKYVAVLVPIKFEKMELLGRVVFDAKGKVSGLQFRPAKDSAADWKAPNYVQPESFVEAEVKIGSGEWELPGTLSIPKGAGPFPALVLVHGSGSHDRDETIGPNKTFKDLAWGLASRGIAVLRYVKRTKAHGAQLVAMSEKLTVKEEVVDDAVAAVALLRKTEKIDPKKIFVLGHSLGGMMAPSIAREDPQIAGLISLAGSCRPLEQLIVEQTSYILSVSPEFTEEQKKGVEELRKKAEELQKMDLSKDVPADQLPLGAPTAYWRSLRAVDPPAIAKMQSIPLLILQGGNDYQVTKKDFDRWKSVLGDRAGVESRWYPTLSHLFMAVEAPAKPAHYQKEGHVEKEVVDDIASWIKKS